MASLSIRSCQLHDRARRRSSSLLGDYKRIQRVCCGKGGLLRTGERCKSRSRGELRRAAGPDLLLKKAACFQYEQLEYSHKLIKTSLVLNKLKLVNKCIKALLYVPGDTGRKIDLLRTPLIQTWLPAQCAS